MRTLIIDNYDSFTFNLYQLIAQVAGEEPIVIRNDQMSWAEVCELPFDNIVLSPGPGRPDRRADFGLCARALREATAPILGICLGHQGIAHDSGGRIVLAPEPMHGRLSAVYHEGHELFSGIPSGFEVVRYHSLMAERPLPPQLEVSAWTEDGVIMGLGHRTRPIWGVQFHPESISTEHGARLIENFQTLSRRHVAQGAWGAKARSLSVVPAAIAERAPTEELELVTRKFDWMPDPERAFIALHGDGRTAWWLDSSMVAPGLSRWSFMGGADGPLSEHVAYQTATRRLTITARGETTTVQGSIFEYLRQRLAERRLAAGDLPFDFNGGYVGYFGYELKGECGAAVGPRSPQPDAQFIFADRLVAFDEVERTTYLVAVAQPGERGMAEAWIEATAATLGALSAEPEDLGPPTAATGPSDFRLVRDRPTYLEDVRECQRRIRAGESYEVCLTNKVRGTMSGEPFEAYRRLRRRNPAPYAAYLALPGMAVICSSPERFLRVGPAGEMDSKPIKGTRPRGCTLEEDVRIAEALRSSEKDRSENLMIVDLVRNDLGLVSEIGSVTVPALMQVESYATVHQLVSTIRSQLRDGLTAIDAVRASFPGGSMTGAPKRRTMQIIDELEREARGVYSGSIGWLGLGGAADLNIVIRTAVVADGEASIGVGGAVVALSDVAAEFDEMVLKSRAVLAALLPVGPDDVDRELTRLHRAWRDQPATMPIEALDAEPVRATSASAESH